MKIFVEPERKTWKSLLQRPYVDNSEVMQSVQDIMDAVQSKGDIALKEFAQKFDRAAPSVLQVSAMEIEESAAMLSNDLKAAITTAAANIRRFHEQQISKVEKIETMPGVICWRRSVGIEKVGLYIPGGTAPLFSTVLMLGIPAVIAGCKEIILCTPCDEHGKIHPAVLFAAKHIGIKSIYKVGGAQAIAAMCFGTETIPAVYKIFGPGNQYVTAAKQLAQQQGVAIDMPAGPSEVCVLADESADADFIAADLLSQAEHGTDSQVLLVTIHQPLIEKVLKEVEQQLANLPRKEIAAKALANSKVVFMKDINEAIEMVNCYAPEHLIVNCVDAAFVLGKIMNAGSVFIGNYSPESAGDYASGTNHTLPTNGFARVYSGVSVDSFTKKITYQQLSEEGIAAIGKTIVDMAEAEGLQAHADAVKIRLAKLDNQ